MDEFEFIRKLREQTKSRNASTRVITGIGDDGSVIRQSADRDLVVTTDLLVEEIDFHRAAIPPQLLGHKALAVSLSDIAAMGARPICSLVSIGLPDQVWRSDFKDEFFAGYLALAERFGVTLAGGDISQSKQIVIDSIVLGEVAAGSAVLRSRAKAGDQIFVTGALGGAAAGLKLIELGARVDQRSEIRSQRSVRAVTAGTEPLAVAGGLVSEPRAVATGSTTHQSDDDAIQALLLRQLQPQPRVGWGIILGEEQLATSMIDISDGLSSDLHHLCTESNVGALIESAAIPIDQHVKTLCGRRALDPLALALHGGEDFELLFTVRPADIQRLPKLVDGNSVSRIGEITDQAEVIRLHEKDRVWNLEPKGFEHFAK